MWPSEARRPKTSRRTRVLRPVGAAFDSSETTLPDAGEPLEEAGLVLALGGDLLVERAEDLSDGEDLGHVVRFESGLVFEWGNCDTGSEDQDAGQYWRESVQIQRYR